MKSSRTLSALFVAFSLASPAWANPRPLPFTYQHEQLAAGETELEQFVDYSPVRARSANGPETWLALTGFQTEFEHGLTSRLELGLYLTFVPGINTTLYSPTDAPQPLNGNGLKQRLRYQLAPSGEWPLDVSVYGELVETDHELELEGKLILQRRLGPARVIGNMTAEQEFYFNGDRDLVLTPSAGLTFEATPAFQPGIEWWMVWEHPEGRKAPHDFRLGPHHYIGPAVLAQFGRLWWTTGVYLRLSDPAHRLEPPDNFGRVWLRTLIGIAL